MKLCLAGSDPARRPRYGALQKKFQRPMLPADNDSVIAYLLMIKRNNRS